MSEAVNGVTEGLENLHLDAATGEMVSKSYGPGRQPPPHRA